MPRDDFSEKVKRVLADRVGYLCSNPDCRASTRGPKLGASDASINLGEASHITAASPGGPRYDSNINDRQRSSLSNGIWLCRNCAALIDRDPAYYTTKKLYQWKDAAEKHARDILGVPGRQGLLSNGNDVEFLTELLTTPPFAVAFEEKTVPDYYFGLHHMDIPVSWGSMWVDVARMRVIITNRSLTNEVMIDGLSIEEADINGQYMSAVQFTQQGASYAIELVHRLGRDSDDAMRIERRPGSIAMLDEAFFRNNGVITVPPCSSEVLVLSFVATDKCYSFRSHPKTVIKGQRKLAPVSSGNWVTVVPSHRIPDPGKQWTIHHDGRMSGLGFPQDNLARFGGLLDG